MAHGEVSDTGRAFQSKRSLIFRGERLEAKAHSVRGSPASPLSTHRQGARHATHASVPGGLTLSVELPQAEEARAVRGLATPTAGRIAGLKVLCIDNEPDVLNGMQALLEGWGCIAMTAQNAAEAVEQLRRSGEVPEIILADFHLDGGTGLEAVAALHAATKIHAPVIIITADHSAELQREVRTRGYTLLRNLSRRSATRDHVSVTLQRAVAANRARKQFGIRGQWWKWIVLRRHGLRAAVTPRFAGGRIRG